MADLKAEDGWLSVTGLYWLRPGETRLGSDPSNDLLLPDRLPGFVGTLELSEGRSSSGRPRGRSHPQRQALRRAGRFIRTPTSTRIRWPSAT